MFRSMAERKVRAAGYEPGRLPPGQYMTTKWPVLHAGTVPDVDLMTWSLRVFGEVEEELEPDAGSSSTTCRGQRVVRTSTASRAGAASTRVRRRPLERPSRPSAVRCRPQSSRSPTPKHSSRRTSRCLRSRTPTRCLQPTPTASRWSRSTAGRSDSSSPAATSGRAPSGCEESSSRQSTDPASGSVTATTRTPTPGKSSGS